MIGSDNSRVPRREQRAHEFAISYPLYMGDTEVTGRQYLAIMKEAPHLGTDHGEDLPIEVLWVDANEFCKRFQVLLRLQTGRKWICRLPTEAEWEYAACYGRPPWEEWWPDVGHTSDPQPLNRDEWFEENSQDEPHTVASKKPNPAGLYDMLGNVSEWCQGISTSSVRSMLAYGWKQDRIAAGQRTRGWVNYACRGGAYYSTMDECRPSARWAGGPDTTYGFRVVATLPRRRSAR